MSTKYFILTKNDEECDNNKNNNYYMSNSECTIILPSNNLDYYIKNGLFENRLIQWAKQFCNKDKNFLDIGAHTGTYSICLAKYVKNVYCFEPQKMTYYALCGGVALSGLTNIECYNVGLGSDHQKGSQKLNVISNDGGGSSMCDVQDVLREETINVITLDSLNISNIGFIKIDVEGNELDVLKGGINTIKQSCNPHILFESNDHNTLLFDYITNELGYKKITKIYGHNNMFMCSQI